MRVCSRHFTRSDFSWSTIVIQSPQKRRLKKGAVPSTCLPVRTHERRAGAAQLRAQEARARRAATRPDVPRDLHKLICKTNVEIKTKSTNSRMFLPPLKYANILNASLQNIRNRQIKSPFLLRTERSAQDKAVQVNTSTAPLQNQRLSDLLTTDASVRAYTGVESMALLNAIVRCAEKIHSQTSELTIREKVILVLKKLRQI
ncbi:unnamed protein product [Ixodes pacificus]